MAFTPSAHIRTILDNLPQKPGVYLMKGERGEVLYIGKARRLRNRVRSYFNQSAEHSEKTRRLRERIRDIDFIVERNEVKALILEETLIKRHLPHFNIALKDNKRYPYIRVTWQDDFPRVDVTRRVQRDGSRYFGPYVAMWAAQDTLQTLRKVFPYLTCDRDIDGQDERACLFHDIRLCNAPCIGEVDRERYRAMIAGLMAVLRGRSEAIVARLEAEMDAAAAALNFERAAALRDQLRAIDMITQKNRTVGHSLNNHDVIALARERHDAVVQILFIRNGRLIGSDSHALEGTSGERDENVLRAFLKRFYNEATEIPGEVILPNHVEEARIIEQWLKDRRGGSKVTITVPQRGRKRELVGLARENAAEALHMLRAQWEADSTRQEDAIARLQQALQLPRPPNRIECFDVSTTQGTAIVASRVVFLRGVARKSEYRRFNIRSVRHRGGDDYQSMREALTRRFARYVRAREKPAEAAPVGRDSEETWRLLPDLLIVDGGQGQLNIALEVLREFGLQDALMVVGLAKRFEELWLPAAGRPLRLAPRDQALHLLQRIRDEAHRFAIAGHRKRRRKLGLASRLETIPGIGPAKRKALLQRFSNSIDAIRAASIEELATVRGISTDLAATIHAELG